MAYRDDLAALAARRDALEHEVASKSRELVETRRLLDEATAHRRLPVLENIRIASPCKARWSAMIGDERTRECADCNKTVFNLSALTRDEAEAVIIEHAGDLCARYYERADGTILLADCTIAAGARRRQLVRAAGAAALVAGAIAGTVGDATSTDAIPLGEHSIEGTRESIQPRGAMSTADDAPPPAPFVFPTTEEIVRIADFAPIIDTTTVTMGGLQIYEPVVAVPVPTARR